MTQQDWRWLASDIVDLGRWQGEFDEVCGRVGARFARVETRRTATKMLAGMVSELPDKNCWTLAEHAGDRSPDAMQHLLSAAVVDDDGLRDAHAPATTSDDHASS